MPEPTGPRMRGLTRSGDIRRTRRLGRRVGGPHVVIWVLEGEGDDDSPTVGVVTSRGFTGATARNMAKRRVRGGIMDVRRLLKPGATYLIECRPGAESVDYQLLVIELTELFSRK